MTSADPARPSDDPPGTVDVLVIGAGPAGALAARALAREGVQVLVVDRDTLPRWKVCGCCLSGGGAAALEAEGLGTLLDDLGAHRPDTFTIESPGRRVRLPLGATRVVSRAAFDHALLDAGRSAGAQVRLGWSATLGAVEDDRRAVELRSGDRRVTVRAALVLGATGLTPLPSRADAEAPEVKVASGSRVGVGAVFSPGTFGSGAPDASAVAMVVGPGGYVGLSYLQDGCVDVAGALDPEALRTAGGIAEAVARILAGAGRAAPAAEPITGWRGTPALTRSAAPAGAERLLLVGDAAGYVEPFTGEGMTWALQAARAVAPHARRIVADGWTHADLEGWHRECRRARRTRAIIRAIAWISRTPLRVDLAMALVERAPRLAAPFIHAAGGAPRVARTLRSRSA